MKRIVVWLGIIFLVFSCGGKRFRADCKLESYGVVDFYNFSDMHKTAFIQREYDGHIIETITRSVRPRNIYRFRLPPGYYYLGAKYPDGTIVMTEKPITLSRCANERFVMRQEKPIQSQPKIKSRRSGDGIS